DGPNLQQRGGKVLGHAAGVEPLGVKGGLLKTLGQSIAQNLTLAAHDVDTRIREDVAQRSRDVRELDVVPFPLHQLGDFRDLLKEVHATSSFLVLPRSCAVVVVQFKQRSLMFQTVAWSTKFKRLVFPLFVAFPTLAAKS